MYVITHIVAIIAFLLGIVIGKFVF